MTNTKHTPAPWIVKQQWRISDESGDYGTIATLRGETSKHYQTTLDANARIIAAAPELLAACEIGWNWLITEDGVPESIKEIMRAAITKAKGV